jgi:uncharacterized damage-inducible protein DinB
MSNTTADRLLGDLLDSWDRNNTILVNLLRILPECAFDVRVMQGSPSVAEMFTHMHTVKSSWRSNSRAVR